jgi:hypothetical protein
MNTDDLIERLAGDLEPIPAGTLHKRMLRAASVGAAFEFAAVVLVYGLREDLAVALGHVDFWRKLAFTLAVAALGLAAVVRASRPGANIAARASWLLAPFVLIGVLALLELASLPRAARGTTWLGETAASCPWSILLLSVPVLITLLLCMRRFAPTRPALAGLLAGVASGGIAATLYGLHCPEWAASFVATWYALGIAASGVLGATIGSRVLRW